MKPEILARIRELSGTTEGVRGRSLADDLQAIRFSSVLYPQPTDTPWAAAAATEPIAGLQAWVVAHRSLLAHDRTAFDQQLVAHFYQLTPEPRGQAFFVGRLFTPFRPGTPDYTEWSADFADPDLVDLSPVRAVAADPAPDFVHLASSYGYPDNFYVCLADPAPDDPTVFGTDHETFFQQITNEGALSAFFQRYLTPAELLALVHRQLAT
ncbi:hypothetical protein [Hymenobacter bucti]|uniref:SMI1/KNR4 family protein n=1 Tax=Hymenobacter bucti TaxID=1844114 RepID=A0ABW4R358_9BACT